MVGQSANTPFFTSESTTETQKYIFSTSIINKIWISLIQQATKVADRRKQRAHLKRNVFKFGLLS